MLCVANSLTLAGMLMTNCIVLLRFYQVVIWKRVKEFNESFLEFAVTATIVSMCLVTGLICKPAGQISSSIIKYFSSQSAAVTSCADELNPLDIM